MATITLSTSFSFLTAQDWDWDYDTTTANQVTLTDGVHTQDFFGSFTYSGDHIFGTATSTKYYLNGALVYSVSSMSASASKLEEFATTYGDTQETYAYVLRGNDSFNGSSGNDVLLGYGGNDLLNGRAGKDSLYGGTGVDSFRFNTALNATTNVDTIRDFSSIDLIQLDNAIFSKLAKTGALSSANFRATASGNAVDSNDYIVYETDTGKLFYDSNGSATGGKVQFALVGSSTHPTLTAADFVVI